MMTEIKTQETSSARRRKHAEHIMEQLYRVEDLSHGLEPLPIKAMNEWNLERIPHFEYLPQLRISKGAEALFEANPGCSCEGNCSKAENCACAYTSGLLDEWGNTEHHYCSSKSCQCTETNCANRLTDCRASIPYEVYFVNPSLRWGVRAMRLIRHGTILFEYAGLLDVDRQLDEDEYAFTFHYVRPPPAGVDLMIDANAVGNIGRFVNHSCSPNLRTELVVYGARQTPHVLFIAAQDVQPGEQLTISYGDTWWDAKASINCCCGNASCRYTDNAGRVAALIAQDGHPDDVTEEEEDGGAEGKQCSAADDDIIELSDG